MSDAEIYMARKKPKISAKLRKEINALADKHAAPLSKFKAKANHSNWREVIIYALGAKCKRCMASERLHIDHIIPLGKKGPNRLENLQLLCVPCHRQKTNEENGYCVPIH